MPVPSTGWLPVPLGGDPVQFFLPVVASGTYRDGGSEIVEPAGAGVLETDVLGGAVATIDSGFSPTDVDTFIVTLERDEVFAVLLVDSVFAPELPRGCFETDYVCMDDPAIPGITNPSEAATIYLCLSGPAASVAVLDDPDVPTLSVPSDPAVMVLDNSCIPEAV